jgi:hypothetical protein
MKFLTLNQLHTLFEGVKQDLDQETLINLVTKNVDLLIFEPDFPKKRSLKIMMDQIMPYVEPFVQEGRRIKYIIDKVTKELFLDGSQISLELNDGEATMENLEMIFSSGLSECLDDIEKRGYPRFRDFVVHQNDTGKVVMIDREGKENLIFSYTDHIVACISFLKEKRKDGNYSIIRVGRGSEQTKFKFGIKIGKSKYFDLDGNLIDSL